MLLKLWERPYSSNFFRNTRHQVILQRLLQMAYHELTKLTLCRNQTFVLVYNYTCKKTFSLACSASFVAKFCCKFSRKTHILFPKHFQLATVFFFGKLRTCRKQKWSQSECLNYCFLGLTHGSSWGSDTHLCFVNEKSRCWTLRVLCTNCRKRS